jgi:hypothetical protein
MGRKKPKRPDLRLDETHGSNKVLQGYEDVVVAPVGLAMSINAPSADKIIIKEVPAKVDGLEIGIAQIYEDGSVSLIINDDAPQWAKDKIDATADAFGYTIGEELKD